MLIATAGNGAQTTLAASTTTGQWIGYQILMGAGRGMAMQVVSCLAILVKEIGPS